MNVQLKLLALVIALGAAPCAYGQGALLSEDEALKSFKEAAKMYRAGEVEAIEPVMDEQEPVQQFEQSVEGDASAVEENKPHGRVIEMDQKSLDMHAEGGGSSAEYAPIEDINITIDIENKTLEEVVGIIIANATDKAGPWSIKWRVSPENSYVLSEKVNLIAETTLSNFMSYLVDRVNNMTGIQLFVTVFDKSRIIVISDTYY